MVKADARREPKHRQMLRYWWAPAAVSGVLTLFVLVIGVTSRGLQELANPSWLGVLMFGMGVTYFAAGAALLCQYVLDRQDARRLERAGRREVLSDAELRYLGGASRLEQKRLRARILRGSSWKILGQTLLLPVTVLLLMLSLGKECEPYFQLVSDEWHDRILLLIGLAAISAGVIFWWLRVSGLRQDRFIVHAVVLDLGAFKGKNANDVGLYVTGVASAELKVRIEEAWRLTSRGLESATGANWTGERYLQRSPRLAAALDINEEVVLVCFDDGRVVGRLGDFLSVGAVIPAGIR